MRDEELPAAWTWVSVDELAANSADITDGPFGSNLKSAHYTDTGPRVIRLQNIGDGVYVREDAHIAPEHFETLRKHEAKPGDVVVAMLGEALPRACRVPDDLGPAIVKADCVRLRPDPRLTHPAFVTDGLNSAVVRDQAKELVHGVGRPRLGLNLFRTLRFPLAPVDEQLRVLDEVGSYLSRLEAAVASLDRAQAKLKAYRASVLKAAVEGRLVPTEAELARKEKRDFEPADVLLRRILAERRRRWEQAELAKLTAAGKPPKDDKWKAKYEEPTPPDPADLPQLPEGWCWATIGQFADVSGGLTKNAARDDVHTRLPYLRVANVYADRLVLDEIKEIGVDSSERDRVELRAGDLLVVEGNGSADQIGRVARWDGSIRPIVHQNHLIKVRSSEGVNERWLLRWLLSPAGRRSIQAVASSTSGLHTLSISKIEKLVVALPPSAESNRILDKIDEGASVFSKLEGMVERDVRRVARLRQSILKWAFEGKLVDQDPSDEPAEKLLARIRAERAAAPAKGRAVSRTASPRPAPSSRRSRGRSSG